MAKLKVTKLLKPLQSQVRVVPIDYPQPDPDNPRKHNSRNKSTIKTSIEEHGQVVPILVDRESKIIISGHGTLEVMKGMGFEEVGIIETDAQGTARAQLRDLMNRASELGEWDFELLAKAFKQYGEDDGLLKLGWEEHEIAPIMQAEWKPPAHDDLNLDNDHPPGRGKSLDLTTEQREVIDRAVSQMRIKEGDETMTEGRCIELICADYLAG